LHVAESDVTGCTVSVYQSIFLMKKVLSRMTTAAVYRYKMLFYKGPNAYVSMRILR